MKRMILTLAVAAGVLCGFQRAQATPLSPGDVGPTAVIPDTIPAAITNVLADTTFQPYGVGSEGPTGAVREIVAVDAVTGDLDFIYQATVTSGHALDRLTGSDFDHYTTDVSAVQASAENLATLAGVGKSYFNATVVNDPPYDADRSTDGTVVGFNFLGVPDGAATEVLIIRTNAKSYKAGFIGLSDGHTSNADGFAPSPEPASLGLFGCCFAGLCGVGLLRLRRRKAAPVAAV